MPTSYRISRFLQTEKQRRCLRRVVLPDPYGALIIMGLMDSLFVYLLMISSISSRICRCIGERSSHLWHKAVAILEFYIVKLLLKIDFLVVAPPSQCLSLSFQTGMT